MICWGKQQSLPHTKPYQTGVEHGRSGRVVLAARPAAKRNLARSFLRRKDQGESRLHASRQNFQKYPCTQPLRAHPTSPYRETAPREGTIRWIPTLLSLPIQEERRDLRRKKRSDRQQHFHYMGCSATVARHIGAGKISSAAENPQISDCKRHSSLLYWNANRLRNRGKIAIWELLYRLQIRRAG